MIPTRYFPVFNRKKKLRKDGAGPVHIQVYRNRKQRFFATGIYLLSENWDPNRWVINRPDAKDLNERIRRQIHDLEDYEYKARARGETFRLSMLPSRERAGVDLLTYMDHEIKQADLSPGTRRQHRSTLNHLIRFGKIVSFDDVTRGNIERLDKYLRDNNCQQSSIYGTHKRLKKWIRKAIIDGLMDKDPYLEFKPATGNRNTIRYLDPESLRRLEEKELRIQRLDQVRDVFIFSCYTGLAYQEVESLTPANIRKDEEGTMWITGERQKVAGNRQTEATGEYMVPLHDKALRILEKYRGARKGYSLPVITNQKYNAFLQEIAVLCEIDLHLTSHVARHTFATTFTLAKGVSMESVQKMMGHASIRMTEKYAKVLKDRVREDMRKVMKSQSE